MGSSWVRVGDLAVLWELQTFLRISILLQLSFFVWLQWAEWKHLVCAVLWLHAWVFGISGSISFSFSHTTPSMLFFLFYHLFLFSSLSSLFFLLSLSSLSYFSMYFGSTLCSFVVVTAQCYVQNDFLCPSLPYPWANSLALIVYHCHPLTLKTATLRLGTMREAFSLQ